jgi:acetate kinase
MAILVVNSGSSSLKLTLFDGNVRLDIKTFEEAKNVTAIGHRFVHGGTEFCSSVLLNKQIIEQLSLLSSLAPLHNEASLKTIESCTAYFGATIPQIAVFDTAFYKELPLIAKSYAIPYELTEKYQIRRYGFHGIAHASLWGSYVKETGKTDAKVITLHLGSGCSITAIDSGKPIDTSMGFTPAEGLVMATRAGDIDSGLVEYLRQNIPESLEFLNTRSGLLGISGISSKMEELVLQYETHSRTKLAIDLFCYRAQKYIGAYIAALQGVDALIFSGGIGENSSFVRNKIAGAMQWLGIEIDDNTSDRYLKSIQLISTKRSRVAVYVIASDENRYIAKETLDLLGRNRLL